MGARRSSPLPTFGLRRNICKWLVQDKGAGLVGAEEGAEGAAGAKGEGKGDAKADGKGEAKK